MINSISLQGFTIFPAQWIPEDSLYFFTEIIEYDSIAALNIFDFPHPFSPGQAAVTHGEHLEYKFQNILEKIQMCSKKDPRKKG